MVIVGFVVVIVVVIVNNIIVIISNIIMEYSMSSEYIFKNANF